MQYEHLDWNLKDFIGRFMVPKSSQSQFLKSSVFNKPSYTVPLPELKSVLWQILSALKFCHDRGIMHRNLKPENILVHMTHSGPLVKITDFAFSRQLSLSYSVYTPEDPKEREQSGREARRLWYRAPELLLRQRKYSLEVDMWTVGCLLAEMALATPVFFGDSEIDQLRQICSLIGTPDATTLDVYYKDQTGPRFSFPAWPKVDFKSICAPKDSAEAAEVVEAYLNRQKSLAMLIKLKETIGKDGLDLLQRLLDLNPETRLKVSDALAHPFFGTQALTTTTSFTQELLCRE